MLIEEIDGGPANLHPLARLLVEAGFIAGGMGLQPTFSSSRQSPIPGQQSSVPSRPSPATERQARDSRGSKSALSSPFARRVFETDE